jgi:nucleotide-binding universal stress UspA family protein
MNEGMSLVHKILHATDFSESSERAFDYAVELARALSAPLVLAHVYSPPVVVTPDGYTPLPVDLGQAHATLEAGLGKLATRARERGVPTVDTVIGTGIAWQEILRIAKDGGCDFIVMGTHGRNAFAHFLLGSVAEKVVRKADCAVLTVGKRAHAVDAA